MLQDKNMRVLVVGAGGFVGGYLCDEALKRGYEVWAGIRSSTSREYLGDDRLHFVEIDFDSSESIARSLRGVMSEGERWDYVVYNLGATKCLHFTDFNRINYILLKNFTEALHQESLVPRKMLYMSSLSAMGPGDERHYKPYVESMIPMPNTRDGASKLKAEMWLQTAGVPCVVFRATGVYGPRDKDYFLMFKSIAKGFDFAVGYRKQLLSFIYVEDLAGAVYDALEKAPAGSVYIVGEERGYTQREFRTIVCEALGKRRAMPVRLPLWAVRMVSAVAEKIGVAKGKPSTLNRDKYRIMAQRNWLVDTSAARRDFGFVARVDLKEGVRRCIEWSRGAGWL